MMPQVRLRIDPESRRPVSDQLAAEIERRIVRGALDPGARIPPVRELAAELDLAPNTVAKAYRRLEASGLLVARGRRGTFVADRLPDGLTGPEADVAEAARRFVARARQLGSSEQEMLGAVRRAMRSDA
jgi:DNA-binding transcriptional regulator YhcF (GntR family)